MLASGSKQQTADMLGVTVTNVSLLLNKLEKDFDEQLLIRSKRAPLQLTPAGQLLLRYTDRMLGLCNDALTAAKDLQNVRTGTMAVGASQTTGIYLMPKLLGGSCVVVHILTDVPSSNLHCEHASHAGHPVESSTVLICLELAHTSIAA